MRQVNLEQRKRKPTNANKHKLLAYTKPLRPPHIKLVVRMTRILCRNHQRMFRRLGAWKRLWEQRLFMIVQIDFDQRLCLVEKQVELVSDYARCGDIVVGPGVVCDLPTKNDRPNPFN